MPDDCTKLDKGDMRFYDNYVPTLGVGDYVINVAQRFNPLNQNPAIDDSYVKSQPFSVSGPRYTLPPEDIFSIFPPSNALGVFDQFLPHVVFTKQELPWERHVFGEGETDQQTPWLALLLFSEDEVGTSLLLPNATEPPNRTVSINMPAATFHDHHGDDKIIWPVIHDEWYETDEYLSSTQCTVIDLSPQAFARMMPCRKDLRYLSHVRQVDPTAKESEVLKISGAGWYSVVVGNRLPASPAAGSKDPPKRNIAHLVSLEGFEHYILEDHIDASNLQNVERVRMISLKSWSFTCHPELNESFAELVQGLLHDNVTQTNKSTTFVLPVSEPLHDSPDAQHAYRSIHAGYVPLRYHTRLGEQTFAWYRGPFSPLPVQNFISTQQQSPTAPDWKPFATASSALIYDKTRGLFDVSYAVAWETGRLLALSNGHLSQELLDWQRKGHHLLDLIIERKKQIPALKDFDPNNPTSEKDLLDQIQRYAVTGDFMTYLLTRFSEQIALKLSEQPHDPPANPFPAYPDQPSPPANPQSIADLLQQTDVMNALREVGGQELDDICDWLAQLYLLIGVPFENLVPNAALLPAESVRFFYLDSNWLEALVEGAMSIGIESSRDRLYQDLMKDLIWNTTFDALQRIRDQQLGTVAHATPASSTIQFDQESLSGVLLRSALVSGYPGLEVNAYTSYTLDPSGAVIPDNESHINLLRMDRVSDDVLLCLWPAVPAVVTIDEPHEGVAFGFEDPPAKNKDGTPNTSEGYWLYLRSLDADPAKYGKPLCTDLEIENNQCSHALDAVAAQIIDPATRILNITRPGGLLNSMRTLPGSPDVNVRDFALQMIKVPERAVFAAPRATTSGGDHHG
jgi:hypothetical protein